MKRVETTSLQFEISINGDRKVLKTIKEIRAERRSIIKQLETQNLTQDEYNKKLRELGKLNAVLDTHKNAIRGAGSAFGVAGKAAAAFRVIVKSLGTSIKTALGPIGLIFAAVSSFVGLGREAAEAASEMQQVTERINQVSGLVGEDLQKASASAFALAKTFETDLTKGIDAANSAANAFVEEGEELGPVFQKSLDGIGDRLLGLGDKGDEFLEQIKQYAPQADQAGLSMDRFFNIVTAGINRGVETDKLIDSIKEFNIRIKDISTGQKQELDNLFGKQFSDEIVKNVETGAISSIEALDKIAEKTRELGTDSAAAQRLVSNLFGGAGEDATAKYLTLIGDIGEELSDVVDINNVYIQRRKEILELEQESADAISRLSAATDGAGQVFKKIGLTIKSTFFKVLAEVVDFIRFFPEYFQAATSSGKSFVNTMISLFENFLRVGLAPIILVFEKLTGIEFKLPRFTVEDDPFGEVEKKIEADRKAFAERQRQKTLEQESKTQEASRLQALKAQQKRFDQLNKAAVAERKKRLEEELKAEQAIEDLRLAIQKDGLEKQIALLKLQAERRIETLKGNENQIAIQTKLIRDKLRLDIEKAEKTDAEKRAKEAATNAKKIISAEQKAFQEREKILKEGFEDQSLKITQQLISDVENGVIKVEDAEKTLQERLLVEYGKYLESRKQLAIEAGKDTTNLELEEEKRKLEALFKEAEAQKEIEREKEELETTAQQSAFDFAEALAEKQFSKELERLEKRKEALEDQEARELERAGDNQAARTAIQKKFAKEREKAEIQQAKKEKQIALKRSLIDFALALFKAISSAPPPINLPVIAAQSALLTIPQGIISAISFGKGGKLPKAGKGGMPQGPSHQEGHIFLMDGKTGQVSGAIEGGEPILSKKTYANNKSIIDRLLFSSMHQGGRKIFREGGFLDSPSTTPTPEVADSTRANPELSLLSEEISALRQDYKAGKVVLVGEQEADLLGDMISDRTSDKVRRSL